MKKVNYAAHLSNTRAEVKAEKTKPVVRTGDVPQTEQLTSDQVKNSAGGYVFAASDMLQLDRFLIMGCEGGTFYASEKKLTKESAKNIQGLIAKDGLAVVKRIVQISDAGRAVKNDPALFALALCAASGDPVTAKAAFDALPKVARIGTHLFTFAEYANALRGWGKSMKQGFANWYQDKNLDSLAYQALKYQQRNGWSHRDIFRLAHVKTDDASRNALYRYIVRREKTDIALPAIIQAYEHVQQEKTVKAALAGIKEHNLSFEMLPTELLKNTDVWEAMLPNMGVTALIRNLGKMSAIGMLGNLSDSARVAIDRLSDRDALRKGRVHPVALLNALKTYNQGHGDKGSLSWSVNQRIVDALNDAFYAAFDFVEPTNKRFLLALDCSGSMWWDESRCVGARNLYSAEAAAVMAMVAMRVEKNSMVVAYGSPVCKEINLSANDRLDVVLRKMQGMYCGGTDASLPIAFADKNNLKVDVFCNYTDNETWRGQTHASVALQRYRNKFDIQSKQAVFGMAVNGFTIADPKDPLQMDFVGFDTASPSALAEFVKM